MPPSRPRSIPDEPADELTLDPYSFTAPERLECQVQFDTAFGDLLDHMRASWDPNRDGPMTAAVVAMSPISVAAPAMTMSLAVSTRPRFGSAARVLRSWPSRYSVPVMSAASRITRGCPNPAVSKPCDSAGNDAPAQHASASASASACSCCRPGHHLAPAFVR